MIIDPFRIWLRANRMLVNATLLGWHVHVWLWGIRVMRTAPERWRILRIWRVGPAVFP